MIEIKYMNIFREVISDAIAKTQAASDIGEDQKLRWIRAINRAAQLLTEHGEFITPMEDHLLIWSDSNEIYEANGACQCKAFEAGKPCKHRAAAKLYKRYSELTDKQTVCKCGRPANTSGKCSTCESESAPYLRQTKEKQHERIGKIRIS